MEPEEVGKRIKELMKKENISLATLSKKMGIDESVLNNKLNGREEFYIKEMNKIKVIFNLDERQCDELFFKEDCKI